MNNDPVVIASVARTPIGGFQGELKDFTAPDLGAIAIDAALKRAGLQGDQIDEVVMGCVLAAGIGQAPARQASLGAGLPLSAGCTTVNKMCGSGLKAAMIAHDTLLAGSAQIVMTGGMESMSRAPYLLPKARSGYRLGHQTVQDHMFLDGLEDAYERGRLMGSFAEDCAGQFNFTRQTQDDFARASLDRALRATRDGAFRWEIAPVTLEGKAGATTLHDDEQPARARPDRIGSLKPAFRPDGTVTAANSSSISDGAAALVLMRESTARQQGLAPLARILGHTTHAQAPALFTTAPVGAIERLLARVGWQSTDVDLYEINEAFAVVTLAAMQVLKLPHEKVNVHGGACALGHPIGASGARILVTLIGALRARAARRGVAALCIGGGEATAMAIELF
jgi:acetyl-CoA C-acetyltransferase